MKWLRVIVIALVLSAVAALIIDPEVYMYSIKSGLFLFGATVFPTMLPFFFFTKLLTSLDFAGSISKFTKRPTKFLYNAPPVSSYIFIMSILSGYPVGAKLISDFYSQNVITEKEAKRISTFCSTSGPLFIVGSIGAYMLGSRYAGYVILLSHYIGALLNGLFYRRKKAESEDQPLKINDINYDTLLSDSINSAVSSVLIVGAYICIFNMLADFLTNVKVLGFIAKMFESGFSAVGFGGAGEGVSYGIIEVTRGALFISKSGLSEIEKTAVISAIVSFGGLSVALQSLTFLGKCKVGLGFYLLSKTTQAVITFIIAYVLALLIL